MRNVYDASGANPTQPLTERMVGDEAYRNVRTVAQISEEIKHLSKYMPQMYRLVELTKSLDNLSGIVENGIDFDKGADLRADLGMPNILTIGEEIKSRNVVPAARLGIKGDGSDETAAWQKAIRDDLPGIARPVELNLGKVHRVASRLDFPTGSGIINPGLASIIASFSDFNNSSFDIDLRYGTNAVVLSAKQGAANIRYEGIKLVMEASTPAIFKEKRVQGIVLRGCPDASIIDVDLSGFNIGNLINIQSCRNFLISRCFLHDSIADSQSTEKTGTQLTAIVVDGDELSDGAGGRLGSLGRIEYARIINMRATAEVFSNVEDQTDGINIAGQFAKVLILHPSISNVGEAIDTFGRVEMFGGRLVNVLNFGVKLVHGAQHCRFKDFYIENIGIAGVTLQSGAGENRDVSKNDIRGAMKGVGVIDMPELIVNGVKSPAIKAGPVPSANALAVLLNDTNPAYPVQDNIIYVTVDEHALPNQTIRATTTGRPNMVCFENDDGTTNLKTNNVSSGNTVRRIGKATNIIAYASVEQAFPNVTTVINYLTKAPNTDALSEWSGDTFNPKYDGKYRVTASIRFPGTSGSDTLTLSIRKNSVNKKILGFTNAAGGLSGTIQHVVDMKVGDNLDVTALVSAAQSASPANEAHVSITITREVD